MAKKINFKNFFKFLWNAVKFVALIILALLLLIAVMIWGGLDWFLRWNPICFVLWSIFAPRRMAKAFANKGELPSGANMAEIIFALWPMFRREFCAWHVHLLPMCLKKWFILEDTKWFSEKAQIEGYRAFRTPLAFDADEANAKEIMKNMSKEARDLFYNWATPKEKVALLQYRRSWSLEDIDVLLSELAKGPLDEFFRNTPSQAVINKLIAACGYGNQLAADYLGNAVWRDGMSPETLQKVMGMNNEKVRDQLLKLNAVRGQVQLVEDIREAKTMDEWRNFLQETPELSASAEREMSVEMMEVFYETGHHLHGDNVLDFVSGKYSSRPYEANQYRKLIFKNEELSELVLTYIKADADIYRLYLQVKK